MAKAYSEIGDRAHVGFWLPMPIDWWVGLRGVQEMIMDLMLYADQMLDLFKEYQRYAVALTEHVLKDGVVDSVGLGGSSTSMSVISPDLHRAFSLPFGKAICDVTHRFDKPVLYHMCGKSRQALPITAEMGVDCFDALECPPTGNVDLAEVKSTFGKKIALRGNVNSIHVMLNGTVEAVKQAVIKCMNDAKQGGGYILGVGDQTPANTPDENIFAMVESGRRHGRYD
jgi:uroporphyrinogen decarboxylase